jgi:hypothetical protein
MPAQASLRSLRKLGCERGHDESGLRGFALLLRLFEISQIRRRLVLLGGHQVAVSAEEIALLADFDITVALGTDFLDPFRPFDRHTSICLGDRPWTRQRVVDRGDLVVEDVR